MSRRLNRHLRGDVDVAAATEWSASGPIDPRQGRKTRQICKEVSRTLACSLGASYDDSMRELVIVAVDPDPDAARLLVTLRSTASEGLETAGLLERLRARRGALRAEVAAALQRKRTPDLAFRIAITSGEVQ